MVDNIKFETLKDGPARTKLGKTTLYMQSKFGNLVLAKELERRYEDQGLISVSLNPGSLQSDLARHVDSWIQQLVLVCTLSL